MSSYTIYLSLYFVCTVVCFFKQKTAYEMRISDWSSDVCSSDLHQLVSLAALAVGAEIHVEQTGGRHCGVADVLGVVGSRLVRGIVVAGLRAHRLVDRKSVV